MVEKLFGEIWNFISILYETLKLYYCVISESMVSRGLHATSGCQETPIFGQNLERGWLLGHKMAPNDQKHLIMTIWGPFGPQGTLASLSRLAILGPKTFGKRAILGPSVHIIGGWQYPKLLQTNFVYA